MKKADLKNLSTEYLRKKEKGTKTLIRIFIPLILALIYFSFRDYMNGRIDYPIIIISICSIGGLVSLFPELKNIRQELVERSGTEYK